MKLKVIQLSSCKIVSKKSPRTFEYEERELAIMLCFQKIPFTLRCTNLMDSNSLKENNHLNISKKFIYVEVYNLHKKLIKNLSGRQ